MDLETRVDVLTFFIVLHLSARVTSAIHATSKGCSGAIGVQRALVMRATSYYFQYR